MTGEVSPGSSGLWHLGETFGIVPSKVHAGTLVGDLVHDWWSKPRTFGCDHAARDTGMWFVAAPDRHAWCLVCADALLRAGRPNVCIVCHTELDPRPRTAPGLVIVEDQHVRFVFVMCAPCNASHPEVF